MITIFAFVLPCFVWFYAVGLIGFLHWGSGYSDLSNLTGNVFDIKIEFLEN